MYPFVTDEDDDRLTRQVVRFLSWDLCDRFRLSPDKVKSPGESSMRQVAEQVGISVPVLTKVRDRIGGRKSKFETRWAKLFYGDSMDALLKRAREWAAANPEDDYDAVADALEKARGAKGTADEVEALKQLNKSVATILDSKRLAQITGRRADPPEPPSLRLVPGPSSSSDPATSRD